MKTQITHQGDVAFIPRPHLAGAIPTAKPIARVQGRIILAEGEVTGHHHAVVSDTAEWFATDDGKRFLRLVEATDVVHEEHGTVTLDPGTYEVGYSREYSPQEIRRVLD